MSRRSGASGTEGHPTQGHPDERQLTRGNKVNTGRPSLQSFAASSHSTACSSALLQSPPVLGQAMLSARVLSSKSACAGRPTGAAHGSSLRQSLGQPPPSRATHQDHPLQRHSFRPAARGHIAAQGLPPLLGCQHCPGAAAAVFGGAAGACPGGPLLLAAACGP